MRGRNGRVTAKANGKYTSVTRGIGVLLLAAVAAAPAYGQARRGEATSALTCGVLKAESAQDAGTSRWTISGPAGKVTETGTLRAGPRFDCVDDSVLIMEFTSTAGYSVFGAYFPDGSDISYGRQQIAHRGGRYVLPIQARARIAAPFRAAFDYHCRLDMPADPIPPAARADCVF
jgi:hypothetical protein